KPLGQEDPLSQACRPQCFFSFSNRIKQFQDPFKPSSAEICIRTEQLMLNWMFEMLRDHFRTCGLKTEPVFDQDQPITQFSSCRSVLELGSGVGLTGIGICRSCSPNRFIFSDCHASVLQKLRENVQLNGLSEQTSPSVRVDELDWTTASDETIRDIGCDTVIAADVVYDPDVAGSLVKLLVKILNCSSAERKLEIFICSTVRNPETYDGFKRQLETAGISHRVMSEPVPNVFPYDRLAPIELIKLFR
uniref:Eukaryotic elongation factor 2 lysine methyltransferase n=2 Tax=Nothobranchius TaxID=28779 RepID=A0A8C6LZ41_NOTFU